MPLDTNWLFQSTKAPQITSSSLYGNIGDTTFSKDLRGHSGRYRDPNPKRREFDNLVDNDSFAADLAAFGQTNDLDLFKNLDYSALDAEGFRNLGREQQRRLFNERVKDADFFSDAPLQQFAGLTGEGGVLGEEDVDPFARYLEETPNTLGGNLEVDADGFAVLRDADGGTIKLNPDQVEHFGDLIDSYGEVKATLITTLADEALADQVALDEKFTEEDLEVLWDRSITVDEKQTTLDELYGQDEVGLVRAGKDWDEFLDTAVDPEDPGGIGWGEFLENSGHVLPEVTADGFTEGSTDDETMNSLLDKFMGWKVAKNTAAADKIAQDEIDAADAPAPIDMADEDFLSDFFGTEDSNQIMTALLEGVRTEEQIGEDFEGTRQFARESREQFTKPEERAVARENAGFLGGGVSGQLARNESIFQAEESTARTNFELAARQTNLAAVQQAVEVAKTPAQMAEAYSRVGINLAETMKIRAQADGIDADTWIKEVMLPHQIEQIEAMNDIAGNQNYSIMLQNAAAIHGIDSAFLHDSARMYNERFSGIFADPSMGVYMALLNMNLFENMAITSGGEGMDLLSAAAGAWAGGGFPMGGGAPAAPATPPKK